MSHRPHPDGYTCTRVPLEGAAPDETPGSLPLSDQTASDSAQHSDSHSPAASETPRASAAVTNAGDHRASRERGDAWIEEAIEALKRGDLPRANQASDFVMTFEYEFTSTDRRTYRIELVDYSGELLNPRDLSDSESLAAHLREHLVGMDGLLVVAEAPRSGETEHLSNELTLLRQAFVALRGEKQEGAALDTPVALLVSKWDRQSDLGSDLGSAPVPDDELQKLDLFFESPEHGEYRQLKNDLQNGVTPGNFRAFPVSALGPVTAHQRKDGTTVERPSSQAPLPSFGMEDGFVWAARRCDALALRECEEKSLGLSWLWPPWRAGSGRIASQAAQLTRRFPSNSPEQQRALKVARTCRAKQMSRGALAVAFLVTALLAGEAIWDREAFKQGAAALADPTTKPEAIAQHEQWLEDYADSGTHRHFLSKRFVSSEEAYQQVRDLRKTRVEKDWQRVSAIQEVFARAQAARQHRQRYENSPHLNEAIAAIEAADKKRESDENNAWWQLLLEDSERALGDRNEADLNTMLTSHRLAPVSRPGRRSRTRAADGASHSSIQGFGRTGGGKKNGPSFWRSTAATSKRAGSWTPAPCCRSECVNAKSTTGCCGPATSFDKILPTNCRPG